jgi:hypothetical protein
LQPNEKIAGILFTAAAIGFNSWYMGRPVIFLNIGLAASLLPWLVLKTKCSKKLPRLYLAGILVLAAHFGEEYSAGFYKAMPQVFDAAPWTGTQFTLFNSLWLGIFLLAAAGVVKNIGLSWLVVWFFVLVGCIGNGILHIGMSMLRQEYFPGTVTAIPLL